MPPLTGSSWFGFPSPCAVACLPFIIVFSTLQPSSSVARGPTSFLCSFFSKGARAGHSTLFFGNNQRLCRCSPTLPLPAVLNSSLTRFSQLLAAVLLTGPCRLMVRLEKVQWLSADTGALPGARSNDTVEINLWLYMHIIISA